MIHRCKSYLDAPVPIAPLVIFRMLFGLLMLGSTLRFWYLGWIDDHFIQAKVTFKYYGFDWVHNLPSAAIYGLHIIMILAALGMILGYRYRLSTLLFFLSFTYVELIDITYYLNHYYFVSVISFLLIFVPANTYFSLDVNSNRVNKSTLTPRWTIFIFQLQLAIVYIFAGLAKINYEWLINALPLKIWLPANDYIPVIGWIFDLKITPYLFSWVGMLYDTFIVFFLINARTRPWAYASVIVFHIMTGILFQIGVFPVVMIAATWIYFSPEFHSNLLDKIDKILSNVFSSFFKKTNQLQEQTTDARIATDVSLPLKPTPIWLAALLTIFFIFQLLFPWRYLLYPNNHYWSEEGYRFGWRVMLMEKAGTATFYVKDGKTGREGMVDNTEFLCSHQEKQMAMQPDLILQFAHHLGKHYAQLGISDPQVRAEVYVTLNGRPSQLLIDPGVDLTKCYDSWKPKKWILPYEK